MKKPLGSNENEAAFNLIKAANLSCDTPHYALTISPPASTKDVKWLFKRYLSIFKKLKCWYKLYPELDSSGRLHFHGLIYQNHIDYVKDLKLLKDKIGFICVKPITNLTKWNKYCIKEWRNTRKLLNLSKEITPIYYIGDMESYDVLSYFIEKDNSPRPYEI